MSPDRANYARLALLVDQNPAEGHRVAKEAYDRAPNDVNAAMTYAFSLYGLGRTADGIQIMKITARRRPRSPCGLCRHSSSGRESGGRRAGIHRRRASRPMFPEKKAARRSIRKQLHPRLRPAHRHPIAFADAPIV